jgi:hypothetical protein
MNTLQGAILGILTGSTCGDACWHAREEICRCSCGGANHGILNRGGDRPQRTCRIDGNLYELAGILSRAGHDCAATFFRQCDEEVSRVINERFPGLDRWAYGEYRAERTMPVVERKASATQLRWPEVAAVQGACRLIWARPVGTPYQQRKAA